MVIAFRSQAAFRPNFHLDGNRLGGVKTLALAFILSQVCCYQTFSQETFNSTNRHKFCNGFSEYAKGTPLMYFAVLAQARGPTNAKQIAQVEDFLIQAGVAKNPALQNVKGTQKPAWSIKGVVRYGAGKPSASELQFATLFDIRR